MLRIERLGKRFGDRPILDGLELALGPGEYVAVIGESGAGKSTFLNLVAGLDVPDAGRVSIDGELMCDVPAAAARNAAAAEDARTRLRRSRVGFVFQAFHVLPHLTVAQNVELPLVLLAVPPAERQARVQAMLAAVGLGTRGASPPRELSGGELQRVAVARALVHRPALVLADEPTGNLDRASSDEAFALLRRMHGERRTSFVIVTHDPRLAARCDRVVELVDGRVVRDEAGSGPAG
ncbi:MAG: ABC transporter ATP-binding protein [Pseudomonadota bacterium]